MGPYTGIIFLVLDNSPYFWLHDAVFSDTSDARSGESPLNLGEFLSHRGILGENSMDFLGEFSGEFAKNFRGI